MPLTFFNPYIREEAAHLLIAGIKNNQQVAKNVLNIPNAQNSGESKSPIADGLASLAECIKDIEKIISDTKSNYKTPDSHSSADLK